MEKKKKSWKLSGILNRKQKAQGAAEKRNKTKEKEPVLRKNTFARISRMILWTMLVFIFIKGLISTFRPDTLTEAQLLISDFERELEVSKKINNEIAAFAQNFTKEYLTYEAKGENEYRERLKAYMVNTTGLQGISLGKGAAEAVYVQAYRMEQCADRQWDVYVLAEVEYTEPSMDAAAREYHTDSQRRQTYLKVPVYADGGYMAVESLPLFIGDSLLIDNYPGTEYSGTAADEKTAAEASTAVTNFLKAYYEQDETVIDYYLGKNADRKQFRGLDGRYQFVKMDSFKCYQESGQNLMVCIASFQVSDSVNNAQIQQKLRLDVLQEADGKYYIQTISPRITNE